MHIRRQTVHRSCVANTQPHGTCLPTYLLKHDFSLASRAPLCEKHTAPTLHRAGAAVELPPPLANFLHQQVDAVVAGALCVRVVVCGARTRVRVRVFERVT